MSQKNEGNFNTLPVGRLGIIPLAGCVTLGQKVDNYLVQWRTGRGNAGKRKSILPSMKDMNAAVISSNPRLPVSVPARAKA